MKVSGKGVLVIIVFIILIPASADLILSLFQGENSTVNLVITKKLLLLGLKFVPWYVAYLIVAFTLKKAIKDYKKQKTGDRQ